MNNLGNSEVNYCTIALVARAACVVFAKSAVYVSLRNQLFMLPCNISCFSLAFYFLAGTAYQSPVSFTSFFAKLAG